MGKVACRRCHGSSHSDRSSARRLRNTDSEWMAAIRTPSKRSRFSSSSAAQLQRGGFSRDAHRPVGEGSGRTALICSPNASRLCPSYGDQCAGQGPRNLGVRSAQLRKCTIHSDRLRSECIVHVKSRHVTRDRDSRNLSTLSFLRGQPCRPFEVSENTSVP